MTTGALRAHQARGWLRRNAIALVAIIILFPTAIAITLTTEWGAYNQGRATQAVAVVMGDTADFGGARWTVESARTLDSASGAGRDARLPLGSDLMVVTIRVEPRPLDDADDADDAPSCSTQLVQLDGSTVARRWTDAGFSDISWVTAEGVETFCDSEIRTPYSLESLFVVPHATTGDLAIIVEVADQLPRFLQISLPL